MTTLPVARMDPLSAIASVLSVAHVLGTSINTLRGIANSSVEYYDMLNELLTLQAWMSQVHAAINGAAGSGLSFSTDVLPGLDLIRVELGTIIRAVDNVRRRMAPSRFRAPDLGLQRTRNMILQLRDRARRCREDLSGLLDLVGFPHQWVSRCTVSTLTSGANGY